LSIRHLSGERTLQVVIFGQCIDLMLALRFLLLLHDLPPIVLARLAAVLR